MSHEIKRFDYPVKGFDKKKVESSINEYVKHATWEEGGSGLYSPIRYIDKVCNDYQEACDYIESQCTHSYDQVAVKYKRPLERTKSKSYEAALKKVGEAYKKYTELNQKFHFEGHKSEFIGCKNCGSKIASEYLHTNFCPVCRHDMRPASTLERIDNLRKAWVKAQNDAKELERKETAKLPYEERWLIRIEYHV